MILTNENIMEFSRTYDWQKRIDEFEKILLPERWTYIEPREENRAINNPILANYIKHTFIRLYHVCIENQDNESKYLYLENDKLCFNNGLFTKQYEKSFVLFKIEWSLLI